MGAAPPTARSRPQAHELDRWLVRMRLSDAVAREAAHVKGVLLDVGCGSQPYRSVLTSPPSLATGYVGVDVPSDRHSGADVLWDGKRLPLRGDSVDHAVLTEVLEHCPEPAWVLQEVRRVLRPSGRLFLTVPFLWPLHEVPNDEYRYTPFALERLLTTAGFADVRLEALGGWDASLAQMIGLWVRRRPMRAQRRRVLSRLAVPVVTALAARDRPPTSWRESTMITGLSGSAVKPPG